MPATAAPRDTTNRCTATLLSGLDLREILLRLLQLGVDSVDFFLALCGRELLFELGFLIFRLFLVGFELSRISLGGGRLVGGILDHHAATDGESEDQNSQPHEKQLKPLLRLVLTERVQLLLVSLARGELGQPGLGFSLHLGALQRGLLERLELGLTLLFLERFALSVGLLGTEPLLFFFLPAALFVGAALFFLARTSLRVDFLLLLAVLRVAQNLLNGDHYRRFLPFRHVATFLCGVAGLA